MRSETTWYAFDDTEFDSKEECEEYERTTLDLLNSVMFFDDKMKLLKNPSFGDIESYAFRMIVLDAEKAKELFEYLPQYISFEPPNYIENGSKFEFNEDDQSWVDLQYEYDVIGAKLARLKKAYEESKGRISK